MKRGVCYFLSCLSLFYSFPVLAVDTYTLDPLHTYVLWHINHFGYSNPSGKWMASGTLLLDQQKPQNNKVMVTIALNNMITGIPELDKHLASATFFDMVHFPTATFVSDKVKPTGKNTFVVHGQLNLHGVTKPINLQVKLNKLGMNPLTNKDTVGYSATTHLKRSDFGISSYLPDLGDEIKIEVEVEATKSA